MIGMGDSGKPDIAYTCPEQAAYFQALLDTLGQTQLSDIQQNTTRELARSEQDLIGRGLGNTTIRESVRRRWPPQTGRTERA